MGDGGDGWETSSEGDAGDSLDTGQELVNEDLLVNVENIGWEGVTVRVDLDDSHTVGERRDVQHVEQSGLGGTDTGTLGDDLNLVGDLDGTTCDLGRDRQGLEERGLSWLHTGVSGWDEHVDRGKSTGTSGSSNLVGENDLTNVLEVTGGEDETNVSPDEWHEFLELREVGEDGSESTSNHGVLSHEDYTLASESNTDLVELLRTDIVNVDDEDRG